MITTEDEERDAAEMLAITGLRPMLLDRPVASAAEERIVKNAIAICDERAAWPWPAGLTAMVTIYRDRAAQFRSFGAPG